MYKILEVNVEKWIIGDNIAAIFKKYLLQKLSFDFMNAEQFQQETKLMMMIVMMILLSLQTITS